MYSKEELISKPIEELETIARTLGSDLSAADGAEALVNFIIGDFSEEETKPKKKASTKKAEKTEGEEPVVKKKRGRPSKADLAARAAEEALKNLNNTEEIATTEQPSELHLDFTEESANQPTEEDNAANAVNNEEENSEEAAPKKKRSRRSKEEIFAAAQAKAAALAANNQKKHELEILLEVREIFHLQIFLRYLLLNMNKVREII